MCVLTLTPTWDEIRSQVSSEYPPPCRSKFTGTVILGAPGTGKSSLAQALRGHSLDVRSTSAFHTAGSRMAAWIEEVYVRENAAASFACQVEALSRRARLARCATEATVLDESVESVSAHSRAMYECRLIQPRELATWLLAYDSVVETLPRPRNIVFLTCSSDDLDRRVIARGRERDASVPSRYLEALSKALEAELDEARKAGTKVRRLSSTHATPKELVAELVQDFSVGCL